ARARGPGESPAAPGRAFQGRNRRCAVVVRRSAGVAPRRARCADGMNSALWRVLRHAAVGGERGAVGGPGLEHGTRIGVGVVAEQLEELRRHRQVFLALETAGPLPEEIALADEIADRTEAAERLVPAIGALRLRVEQ